MEVVELRRRLCSPLEKIFYGGHDRRWSTPLIINYVNEKPTDWRLQSYSLLKKTQKQLIIGCIQVDTSWSVWFIVKLKQHPDMLKHILSVM